MGTWFAGDLIEQSDLPKNYQATLSGAAYLMFLLVE